MMIIEHKRTGDKEHIVEYDKMDTYIRTVLEPGVYFTIKGRNLVDPDKTYKAPSR